MASPQIKLEPADDVEHPEGLLPPKVADVPEGFTPEEWAELTAGYDCRADEIRGVIALRGQGGSHKGRPTNFVAPFKGELSTSKRAVAQRERAGLRSEEEKALTAAKDADRQAKQTLKKKIAKEHPTSSTDQIDSLFNDRWQLVCGQRFEDKKSAEWLEAALMKVHKKWDKIQHAIDMKTHDRIVNKIAASLGKKDITEMATGSGLRFVFDKGGVVEKWTRKEYKEGLDKLKNNTFACEEDKALWEQWVTTLDEQDMAMIANDNWQFNQVGPVQELPEESDDLIMEANRPYLKFEDNEAEEEVDWDDELDEMYEGGPDEYESEEAYLAAIAEAEAASESEESDDSDDEQLDSEAEDEKSSDVQMTDVE